MAARADVTVDYTVDAGGENSNPLNGMSARATFGISGNTLDILLENTSTGIPVGTDAAGSLLVSLAFDLPSSITFASGDASVIGPGSTGIAAWSALGPNDTVADEWLWTNDGAGDLLSSFSQVITTSNGTGSGTTAHFTGGSGNVSGPFGGIAADPVLHAIPGSKPAVSDSIFFSLTLTGTLNDSQLAEFANNSIVEFGSDFQYVSPIPAPGAALLAMLGMPMIGWAKRRLA